MISVKKNCKRNLISEQIFQLEELYDRILWEEGSKYNLAYTAAKSLNSRPDLTANVWVAQT